MHSDSDRKLDAPEAATGVSATPKSASRRRLLRAGLSAPAVLTVAAMPVQAGTSKEGRTASAFASVTANALTSTNSKITVACSGDSPSAWVGCHPSLPWPSDCKNGGSSSSFPGCLGITGSSYGNGRATLKSACGDTTSDLARCVAAAYLNWRSNKQTVCSDAQLKQIWAAHSAGLNWSPVGGKQWTWTDTKNWMTTCGVVGT